MTKPLYTAEVVNSHSGFLDVAEIEIVQLTTLNYDFQYLVVIVDRNYQRVEFSRNFTNFRQAFAFFKFLLTEEAMIKTLDDLPRLYSEFYGNKGA